MREAIALAPEHPRVKAAFEQIQQGENGQTLLQACRTYAAKPDETAAQEVLRILAATNASIPAETAKECIPLLYDRSTSGGPLGDELLSMLLRRSPEAKRYLTEKLEDATTDVVFESLWNTGDKATHELISVLLDRSIWPSEKPRHRCEQDVFILLIAKLMEAGQDFTGRALAELGRLFATDAEYLHALLDSDGLAVILSCLDIRSPPEMRSQATFTVARYLAAAQESGQQLLGDFITSRISEATVDNISLAFSAAAAVFPLVPSTASRLFHTDGFAQSLVPLLVRKSKSTRVRQTALEMLSAACIDSLCRETISKYCTGWIEEQASSDHEPSTRIAAVVLAKLRTAEPNQAQIPNGEVTTQNGPKEVEPLVEKFKGLIMKNDEDDETRQSAIEGLAYASLVPNVKTKLANNETFLKRLVDTIRQSSDKPALLFGALSILVNLTRYLPNLSEEQKRMAQLKAYANTSKAKTEPDEEDRDEAVTKRCAAVLHVGVVPVLALVRSKASSAAQMLILNILLSLSKEQKNRGTLAQQGAVKLLLQSHTSSNNNDKQARRIAAHALARILISVDPALLFTSTASPSITSAISPLVSLLTEDDNDNGDDNQQQPSTESSSSTPASASSSNNAPRDLLPTFEALLALTNLASLTDEGISNLIIRQAWPAIEELLLSKHTLVQRAAVELVCNLAICPAGLKKFMDMGYDDTPNDAPTKKPTENDTDEKATENGIGEDGTTTNKESKKMIINKSHQRLSILLALCTAEDIPTRRAAAGALVMLTLPDRPPSAPASESQPAPLSDSNPPSTLIVIDALLRHERFIPTVLELCQDEDDQDEQHRIRYRGRICLRNVLGVVSANNGGESGDGGSDGEGTLRDSLAEQITENNGIQVLEKVLQGEDADGDGG